MKRCIIIRGSAGIGKTTIAKKLANALKADYFSIDYLMRKNNLDTIVGDGIPSKNFIQANEILIPLIKQKNTVIIDGCFYRKEQIDHLLNNLKTKIRIFTLHADLAECLKRNNMRIKPLTDTNVKQVHILVSNLKIGTNINTDEKDIQQIVSEILNHLNN